MARRNGFSRSLPKGPRAPANIFAFLMVLAILLTSLRPAYKYSEGLTVFVLFACAVSALVWWWLQPSIGRWLRDLSSSFVFQAGVIALWVGLSMYFYPMADALKLQGLGQDQDDCLISGSRALLRLENPYVEPTYFGNPCSPLPGAILPYLPFVAVGVFSVAGAAFLAVSLLIARMELGPMRAGLYLAILAATPLTLELLVNGSDFVFMGSGLVVIALLIDKAARDGSAILFVSAGLLVGLVSSTRINMPIVLVFFVAYLLSTRPQGRFVAVGVSVLLATAPSAVIFASDPASFTPLHLVSKGQRLLPGWLLAVMLIATALALFVVIFVQRASEMPSTIKLLLVTAPSVFSLSLADLSLRAFDFATWEGASYLMVIIPLMAVTLAQTLGSRLKEKEALQ